MEDNGIGVSLDYFPVDLANLASWITVETVIVRFNIGSTPSGRFPVYSDKSGSGDTIGYDAAVCVQKYEPWIIEAYNASTGFPSVLQIVGKMNDGTLLPPSGSIRGTPLESTRYLDTTIKIWGFHLARDNAIYEMMTVNPQRPENTPYMLPPAVGPAMPPHTAFLLTLTYSTGHFFHRWRGTAGIHRTLPRPVRRHSRTGRSSHHSTIPCGVRTPRCTIVRGHHVRICHFQAVATNWPPDTHLDSGSHRGAVRTDATVEYPTEKIWSVQLVGTVPIPGMWA